MNDQKYSAEENSKGKKQGNNKMTMVMSIVVIALAIVLILQNMSILPLLTNKVENIQQYQGCDTPEEVIREFADAISESDLNQVISLTACGQMADNFELNTYIENMQSWIPTSVYAYPSTTEIFRDINEERFREEIVNEVANLCFSLQADEEYLGGTLISGEETEEIYSDLEAMCNLDKIKDFCVVRSDYSNPERQNEETWEEKAEYLGADEIKEYTVLYEYDGKMYGGGMTLICYADKWYIQNLVAVMSGQDPLGYLTEMSEEKYSQFAGI